MVFMTKKDLEKILGFTVEATENPDFGDYSSNVALSHKPPREFAEELVVKLKADKKLGELVDKIEIAGPGFINFWLKKDVLVNNLIQIVGEKEKYGMTDLGKGQIWGIEHTSPNPNKAMHLGHLRNNITGMAFANLAEACGYKVIRDCVDNDRGIAIAKLMWGYLKFAKKDKKEVEDVDYWFEHQDEWLTPNDLGLKPDRFVDQLYVKGAEDFEKSEEIEEKVRKLVVDWESEDPKNRALWKKVLGYSYQGQELTLKRLGNRWDKVWHEHEHYKAGKELIDLGLKKGIFKKLSGGAVVTDLSKYKLTDTIVIKSDGTALYITQDLALTKLKKETFKADKLFWVIGPEQSLAMRQVFAVCDQLGIGKLADFTHIAYGYMSLKGVGKMSSRTGKVIYIDDLLDLAKSNVKNIMKDGGLSESEIEDISEKVGVGAVKYSILRVSRLQDMAFDLKESISLEGNSGPYLQYTVARTNSVLAKLPFKGGTLQGEYSNLENEEEAVLRALVRFPEVISAGATGYSPNLLCNYLYDLAQKYNGFYNKDKIIGGENEEFRLALTSATGQVLKNGLKLLGIETPERM
jgi:arginyl-tRNA synthetase